MKGKRLFIAIGGIEDRYIDEDADMVASAKEGKKGRHATIAPWLKWAAPVAACFVLAALIAPNLFSPPVEVNAPATETGSRGEIGIIPPWDEMPIAQKFSAVMFNGVEYTVSTVVFGPSGSWPGGMPSGSGPGGMETGQSGPWFGTLEIGPSEIVGLIGATTASGRDAYEGKEYTINCEVYSLRSIASECAVAVRYEGHDGYYPFKNPYYVPETLGDLIDGLNLRENLVFNQIHYDCFEGGAYVSSVYALPDYSVIWDLLLSDTSVKNEPEVMNAGSVMGISIDVNIIGYRNISLAVDDRGYLHTNILDTGKSFHIGEDAVRAFVEYVLNNGSGTVVYQSDWYREQNDSQPQTIEPAPAGSGIAPGTIPPDDPLGYWTPERMRDVIGK
jgi:hypothetical protein